MTIINFLEAAAVVLANREVQSSEIHSQEK
jgi:hypothetical protein